MYVVACAFERIDDTQLMMQIVFVCLFICLFVSNSSYRGLSIAIKSRTQTILLLYFLLISLFLFALVVLFSSLSSLPKRGNAYSILFKWIFSDFARLIYIICYILFLFTRFFAWGCARALQKLRAFCVVRINNFLFFFFRCVRMHIYITLQNFLTLDKAFAQLDQYSY